jgi:putative tricarboxylic transport membrane protein
MKADRIGGIISIIIGAIAISEAIRLYPMRMSTFAGDHTMPGVVGVALIVLGLLLVFFVKGDNHKVEFPNRKLIIQMVLTIGLLFAYWFAIKYLGYVISTLLVSICLFKVMSSYSWIKSSIYALILAAAFYLVFIRFLNLSFPTGTFINL